MTTPSEIRAETVQRGYYYFGRISIYESGRRLWTELSKVQRLSRSDALRDAEREAHDHVVSIFNARMIVARSTI